MAELTMRQRGEPAVLTMEEYAERWSEYLAILERHKILSVRMNGPHVLIHPNQYAGTARCPAGRIRIEPRFPDLLKELKRLFPQQHRRALLPGYMPAITRANGSDAPAKFIDQLAEAVYVGVPFEYQRRIVRSSTLSGSLDIGRTISEFDSLGVHHRAVVRQTKRIPDKSLMTIVYTVLDALADEELLAPEEAAYAGLLMEALPPRDERATRQEAIELIGFQEIGQANRTDILGLCETARDILTDATSIDDLEYATGNVTFAFTDSDALWERGVHLCLRGAAERVAWSAQLHPMRGKRTLLYPDGGPDTDPDTVVYRDASPHIVVDAKDYATRGSDAAGVYQVSSYARQLGISYAALFYLAEGEEWAESFGDSSVRIRAFGIPPDEGRALPRLRAACFGLINAS